MPAKHDQPFQEGQVGKVYSACYGEPKTGYQAAKETDIPQNRPYEFKEKYESLFADREDNKLLSRVDPILVAIKEDLPSSDTLSDGDRSRLSEFLDSTWRQAYKNAYDEELSQKTENSGSKDQEISDLGPYQTLQLTIGGYSYFYIEEPDLSGVMADKKRRSEDYEVRPITETQGSTQYTPLFEAVSELSNSSVSTLSGLPLANTMWTFMSSMNEFAGFLPIRAVEKQETMEAENVELIPVDDSEKSE